MNKTKFTPGPWRVKKQISNTYIYVGPESDTCGLTATCYSFSGFNDGEANANLIAAAPEMYEALSSIENDDNSIPAPIWNMIRSALTKADGRQP